MADRDDALKTYRAKRDFSRTAEPASGVGRSGKALSFVIQKHAASRLHYDFRLELQGTLKSWAVPKGPSLDPSVKRMGVHVEDHPLSYASFEGSIPPKQYGAGHVIVWDRGLWEPIGDAVAGMKSGKLKFLLHGEKLKGAWTLVRMHGKGDESHEPWLLIKERDGEARPEPDYSVTDALPNSVLTGRPMPGGDAPPTSVATPGNRAAVAKEAKAPARTAAAKAANEAESKGTKVTRQGTKASEATTAVKASKAVKAVKGVKANVAQGTEKANLQQPAVAKARATRAARPSNVDQPVSAAGQRQASRDLAQALKKPVARKSSRRTGPAGPTAIEGAVKAPLPATLSPQLATLVDAIPQNAEDWAYEIKFDGYRLLARIDGDQVRCFTRNGNDWTHKLPRLAAAITELGIASGWLDGEIVVMNERGLPDFGALQNAFDPKAGKAADGMLYYVFDLPFFGGLDLRGTPLGERRELLRQALQVHPQPSIRFSQTFDESAQDLLASAQTLGLEGVIGKRRGSLYSARRSPDWIKLKTQLRQEFVIGGYTAPKGSRTGIGSLLLGVHDDDGKLRYAGNVGTGFNEKTLAEVKATLAKIHAANAPFADLPSSVKGQWVKPKLLAEVAFGEWTSAGHIRHSVFQGLRTDKPAKAIVRETPAHPSGGAAPKGLPVPKKNTPAAKSQAEPAPKTSGRARAGAKKTAASSVPAGSLRITHGDRVIDKSTGITKQALVEHYVAVADLMLPHLKGRPTSLVRAPGGIEGQLFFQKHVEADAIPGIRLLDPSLDPDHDALIEVPSLQALLSATQMNVVEFHTWNATSRSIHKPDRMTFDLDPGDKVGWSEMQEAAQLVKAFLDELGLQSFLKTSGGKGLHVVVPLKRSFDFDTVKDFSQAIVVHLATVIPQRFVAKSGPKNRIGKIFVDYLRNGFGATTASAWSARARPGMGVSVPVGWDELASLTSGAHWQVQTLGARLAVGNTPWDGYDAAANTLASAMKTLGFKAQKR